MVYSDTQALIFFHGHTILNRGHHTEIRVSTVIARHPLNHGHSKRHTSNSIQPRIEFGWTRSAAHVWCPFFVLVPYLTAEIQEICLFYSCSNRTLPWGKCHFSANIAEVIRVVYALPGHTRAHTHTHTTLSMIVECQLKIIRHNSHERTWGHHLQYDRFRTSTTLNKNWREVTGKNLLITWRTPAGTIADHVISSWYVNYGARLECCQLLKTET